MASTCGSIPEERSPAGREAPSKAGHWEGQLSQQAPKRLALAAAALHARGGASGNVTTELAQLGEFFPKVVNQLTAHSCGSHLRWSR
jgi:hypothetical protein